MKAAASRIVVRMLWMMMLLAFLCWPVALLAGDVAAITGEVNDSYQVVADDGLIYEVADTEKGNELVLNHIGEKVKVTGEVEEEDDVKILTVAAFEVLQGE